MNKEPKKGMSLIVKTITPLTAGLILVFGFYIVSHGHVSHGGGFAGGIMIALSFVLLMLAYGKEVVFKKLPKAAALFFVSLGAILFLAMALLGFTGGHFFLNFISKGEPFKLFSAGIIPLFNIAIALIVGAGLFRIFVALVLLKFESEKKQ